MRIICAHNFYREPGGEDISYRAQVDLLRAHGHQVFTYERYNKELEDISPLRGAIDTVWSQRSLRELEKLLKNSRAEVVHFTNTFLRISPATYYACKAKGIAVVQDLRNYRLLCPAANFLRNGAPCEDCLGKTLAWPAVQHACWRSSRSQTAVSVLNNAVHRGLGTWHSKVDRFVALTDFARHKFIQGGLPQEKIVVKPNFVQASPPSEAKREDFVLFVGRLSQEKGILPMLQAWEGLTVPLKIIGDGPLRSQVELAASKSESIQWLGHQGPKDIAQLMGSARALVFPSVCYEGMPRSILEAFAAGLPVIASKLGAMQEMIHDGHTGIHFEAGNPQDLTKKINWALAQPSLLSEMGSQARSEYESKYTPKANYGLLMDIYQQALESNRG
ncbi:MAG: glycosyltransferase family 4 protein [Anaerolineales bacterium]|nr:glycosyltransferase family 4 protein [Anaerolineales bacterium]